MSKESTQLSKHLSKESLSVAARRCLLAKAVMLLSQSNSIVNQLTVTCSIIKGEFLHNN